MALLGRVPWEEIATSCEASLQKRQPRATVVEKVRGKAVAMVGATVATEKFWVGS